MDHGRPTITILFPGTAADRRCRTARCRESPAGQHLADENKRGAIDVGFLDLADDGAEGGPDNPLVRPARAKHHGDRTGLAIGGNEFGDGLVERVN